MGGKQGQEKEEELRGSEMSCVLCSGHRVLRQSPIRRCTCTEDAEDLEHQAREQHIYIYTASANYRPAGPDSENLYARTSKEQKQITILNLHKPSLPKRLHRNPTLEKAISQSR